MSPRSRSRLAAVAGALGALAVFAGSPYGVRHASVDVIEVAREVTEERDQVTAIELAGWIRDRRPGLRVVDLRSEEAFDAFHVPTAERRSLQALVGAPPERSEHVVLVSDGGAHAAQAWVLLRALGFEQVHFLRGGIYEWLSDVMNPTLARSASAEERAAFEPIADLSRYFGGVPRLGEATHPTRTEANPLAPTPATPTAELALRARRRGC